MIEQVFHYINEYHMILPDDAVVAGISGGADSVCLLFVLKELQKKIPFRLLTVHVNHGIRKEAGEDEAYVKNLCEQWNIPFYAIHADVELMAKEQGISTEEAGRNLRYESFQKILRDEEPEAWKQGKCKIAVAHNQNDRAETVLFNLCRGTGLQGLGSIQPVRGMVIRPVLCLERQQIEDFLREKNLSYCTDCTNEENEYTRNRIRNIILPCIQREISPNAVSHMNHAAELVSEAQEFLMKESRKAFERVLISKEKNKLEVSVPGLLKEDRYIRSQVFLFLMEELVPGRKDITKEHVEALSKLILTPGSRRLDLPYGICAQKEYDRLFLFFRKDRKTEAEKKTETEVLKIPGTYRIPSFGNLEFSMVSFQNKKEIPQNRYTKWFDYDKIKSRLMIRTRNAGDYLTIDEKLSRKSLKEYMIEQKIPRRLRDEVYLLADGHHILWVIGARISAEYKVTLNTKNILQVKFKGGTTWENM